MYKVLFERSYHDEAEHTLWNRRLCITGAKMRQNTNGEPPGKK